MHRINTMVKEIRENPDLLGLEEMTQILTIHAEDPERACLLYTSDAADE